MYWLRNDLIKTGCGAILGALIISFPKLWESHTVPPEQTLTKIFADTITVKVSYPTKKISDSSLILLPPK
jgi:hypothetical protein